MNQAIKNGATSRGDGEMAGAQKMMENLWLGCGKAAANHSLLVSLDIRAILIVADDEHPHFEREFQYKQVKVKDIPSEDLLPLLGDCFGFLDDQRKHGRNCLVHCHSGVSRSAMVVLAYMMHKTGLGLDHTLRDVREKRMVCPNAGFLHQLRVFEEAKSDPGADFGVALKSLSEKHTEPGPLVRQCLATLGDSAPRATMGDVSTPRLGPNLPITIE